jgi:hypothetical protein
MEKHHRKVHPSSRKRGRPSAFTSLASPPQHWTSNRCQRVFVQGPQSTYFRIGQVCKAGDQEASPPVQSPKAADKSSLGGFMMVQVLEQLKAAGQEQRETADIIWDRASKTEISP